MLIPQNKQALAHTFADLEDFLQINNKKIKTSESLLVRCRSLSLHCYFLFFPKTFATFAGGEGIAMGLPEVPECWFLITKS